MAKNSQKLSVDQLREFATLISNGDVLLQDVAKQCGISRTTLWRYFKRAGINYDTGSTFKDFDANDVYTQWLLGTSIADIAYSLNVSASSITRHLHMLGYDMSLQARMKPNLESIYASFVGGTSIATLAKDVGVSRQTLFNWLTADGYDMTI